MTLLDGSQVSDRCPLGYLFYEVLTNTADESDCSLSLKVHTWTAKNSPVAWIFQLHLQYHMSIICVHVDFFINIDEFDDELVV